jgi:hypothetical protein
MIRGLELNNHSLSSLMGICPGSKEVQKRIQQPEIQFENGKKT